MFLRNMKARIIQKKFKNFMMKKYVLDPMPLKLRKFFENFIVRFLYRRRRRIKI